MTLSDAFAVPGAAAQPAADRIALEKKAQVGPRARAQGPSVPRVTSAAKTVWSDLRESWWLPASVPTVVQAWRDREPDFDRVPGGSEVLHTAWMAYNYAALVPVALLNLLVGVLTPLIFVLRHPARLALALLIIVPIIAAAVAA